MKKKKCFTAFLCCISVVLCAQTAPVQESCDEMSRLEPDTGQWLRGASLNEVVVTGTATGNPLKDSPVPIHVISGKELEDIGSMPSFENAMMTLDPSFNFTPTAMGSNIQLNGLGNKYILILIDGKKIAGDVNRNVDLSRINMNNVKQIEILKGSASSLYGSEAIGGVINIITKAPQEAVNAYSNTRISGYGQFSEAVVADFNAGHFYSSTSYQRNQSNGWQLSPYEQKSNGDSVETDKKAVNTFYSDVLTQKFGYRFTEALDVYVQGSVFDKKFKRPYQKGSYKFDMLYDDYNIAAGAAYQLKNDNRITFDYYKDNFRYTKVYTAEDGDFNSGDKELTRTQKYDDAHLKGIFNLGEHNRVVAGTQYQDDYLKSKTEVSGGERTAYTFSVYAQDEIRILDKKLQIVPGLRYVYHETFKNKFTPKLSIMYSWNDFNFRGNYSSGFRAPDLKELYNRNTNTTGTALTVGNPNLKPETSNYYSLNVEYTNKRFNLSVTAYHNKISDMIDAQPVNDQITPDEAASGIKKKSEYANISEARVRGIEVSANAYLGAGLSLGVSYTYIDSKNYATGTPLQRVSKNTETINANWNKKWGIVDSNFNFNGHIQSRKYYEDGQTPAFNLWNLSTTHKIKAMGGVVPELGIGIENIFDYVDDRPLGVNYATLSPGRTIYASLIIRFIK
jgi:outer membrane receptor for ferrienterochelin and colicins